MFTPPYGSIRMDEFDHKIMVELGLEWLEDNDNNVDKQNSLKSETSPLKMTKPKTKKPMNFQKDKTQITAIKK